MDVSKTVSSFMKSNKNMDRKAEFVWIDFNTILIKRW